VVDGVDYVLAAIGDVKAAGLGMSGTKLRLIADRIANDIPMHPIDARRAYGKWEVIDGGHRFRASVEAGFSHVAIRKHGRQR